MRHIRPTDLPADAETQACLARFCEEARRLCGDRVGQIIVHGSMARGEGGPESDLDVWVDWHGEEAEGRRILGDLGARLFADTGVLVSVQVVSGARKRRLQDWGSGFYENVRSEGLVVDA